MRAQAAEQRVHLPPADWARTPRARERAAARCKAGFGVGCSPSPLATSAAAVVGPPMYRQLPGRLPPAVLARRVERGLPDLVRQAAYLNPILVPHVLIDLNDL